MATRRPTFRVGLVVLLAALPLGLTTSCGPIDALPDDAVQQALESQFSREIYAEMLRTRLAGMGSPDVAERERPQGEWEQICLQANERDRAMLCTVMAEHLGPDTPRPARIWLLRQIERIGREESVDALVTLWSDPDAEVADAARRALVANPARSATTALHHALAAAARPDARIALLGGLATRHDPASVKLLSQFVDADEPGVSAAAVAGLGTIGGPEAEKILRRLWTQPQGPRNDAAGEALLRVAEHYAAAEQRGRARTIYRDLLTAPQGEDMRVAGLSGLARLDGPRALPALRSALARETDERVRMSLVRMIEDIPGRQSGAVLAGAFAAATPTVQAIILDALAARTEVREAGTARLALDNPDEAVRLAAIRALAALGGKADLPTLARLAGADQTADRDAARRTLNRLPGREVDAAILAGARVSADPVIRVEYIRALSERRYRPAIADLLVAARDTHEPVRQAACAALGVLAAETELPAIVKLLIAETSEKVRTATEDAVVTVSLRIADPQLRASAVLKVLTTSAPTAKVPLLRVLGRVQGPAALEAVRQAAADQNEAVRDAAIRGLTKWEDVAALEDVRGLARNATDPVHRILALRGYVRLVRAATDRPTEQKYEWLREAMGLATQDEDRKLVLAGAGELGHVPALEWTASFLGQPTLRDEAAAAVVAIAKALGARSPDVAQPALERVLAAEVAEQPRKDAQERLDLLKKFAGYITTWEVAGPYSVPGRRAGDLFNDALPPESAPDAVTWQPFDSPRVSNPWISNLRKLGEQEDQCAYVRCAVQAPPGTVVLPARLEIGSDDGVKVWMNGQPVHANLAYRGVEPGQDKVDVTLHAGWNTLMLKIVQAGGDWGFACAIRDRAGQPITGLQFRAGAPPTGETASVSAAPAAPAAPQSAAVQLFGLDGAGVVVRLYEVGEPMSQLPDLVAGQTPSQVLVVPTLDLDVERGGFGTLQEFFLTHVAGVLRVKDAGTYTLRLVSDDGAKLWVDGKLRIDHDGLHGPDPKDVALDLTAGDHPYVVRHFESSGGERLALLWRTPGAAADDFVVIPKAALGFDPAAPRTAQPGRKQIVPALRRGRPGDGRPVDALHPAFTAGDTPLPPDSAWTARLNGARLFAPGEQPGTTGIHPLVWIPDCDGQGPFEAVVRLDSPPYTGQLLVVSPSGESRRVWIDDTPGLPQGCVFRFGPGGGKVRPGETTAFEMLAVRPRSNGFEIEFSEPLDPRVGWDPQSYYVEQWPWDALQPGSAPVRDGRPVAVRSASVASDRRSVFVETGALEAGQVIYLRLLPPCVTESRRLPWSTEAWFTLNRVPQDQPGTVRPRPPQPPQNVLTEEQRAAGWRMLFDGQTTQGWRGFRKETLPDGWQVENGCLTRVGPGGDIITVDQFQDFELSLEWRISPGGNSGIFFRVSEEEDPVWRTGPEMQVLDNTEHADRLDPRTSAGANYALHAPLHDVTAPVGLFNKVRLLVQGHHVEHWLNGERIIEYELLSPEWEALVAASKYKPLPRFGREPRGHIALQDHGDKVWYRNIRIRPLPPATDPPPGGTQGGAGGTQTGAQGS